MTDCSVCILARPTQAFESLRCPGRTCRSNTHDSIDRNARNDRAVLTKPDNAESCLKKICGLDDDATGDYVVTVSKVP